MSTREQFEAYYQREQLPCLSSVKERHWQTWLEAQATLLSAHGPVTMLTMEVCEGCAGSGFSGPDCMHKCSVCEGQGGTRTLDHKSYSKGWKDCMEIVKK